MKTFLKEDRFIKKILLALLRILISLSFFAIFSFAGELEQQALINENLPKLPL